MFIKEFQSTKIDWLTPEIKAVTGLSIGVSMFTGEESIENVIVSADAAVYHSKRLRDNQLESGTYRHGNIITHDK
jgi:GGDEF domain-containing protein